MNNKKEPVDDYLRFRLPSKQKRHAFRIAKRLKVTVSELFRTLISMLDEKAVMNKIKKRLKGG